MRVYDPKIFEDGDGVCVAAKVEVNSVKTRLADELWFRFPGNCREHVTDHLNGFAVALLPLAMTLGEDLHLEGVLSPHLLQGLNEYQRIQCTWKPTSYQPVDITADQLQAAEADPGATVGCSFSGGVDSFHTLWRHIPENEPLPQYRVSHCLMINGFDSDADLQNEGHFSNIQKALEPVMVKHDLQLIVCRTNYMDFSDPNILKQSFAAMVTAPALVLGGLFSCFFVPSSYRFDEFLRDGSHLMLDHLISTESMHTIHDSSYLYRPEKTAVIANWSETYSALRVCFGETGYDEETNSIQNCSRCEKCIRTMKTLELYGGLENYSSFSRTPGHFDVWKCYYGDKGARAHAMEIVSQAWKTRKFSTWFDYCFAITLSFIVKVPRELLRSVHLFIEERSEFYAVNIRRLVPGLRTRARWIR